MLIVLAAMMSASCVEDIQTGPDAPQEGDPVEVTFTASYADETRTTLVDGVNVWWMPGDRIAVKGADAPFETTINEPSSTAKFTGTVGYASEYLAVYPYDAVTGWDSGKAYVELPSVQNAVKGTFDNGSNISVAKTFNRDLSFRFRNVLGYVKFTVTQQSGSICSASVSSQGLGGEGLCGTVIVDCTSDSPSAVISGSGGQTVTLVSDAVMQPGDYYVALVPGTYSQGLDFVFTDNLGRKARKSISRSITLSKGQIRNIGEIKNLDFSGDQPDEPDTPVDGDYFVINVPVAGTLNTIVTTTQLGSYENIRITGNFNSDDVDYFTNNADKVRYLDMSSLRFEDDAIDGGFNELVELKEVYMPVSLKTITGKSFSGCTLLEKVHWGQGSELEVIGIGYSQDDWYNLSMHGPFSYCASLKSIDIPANVMTIKTSAFYGSGLTSVKFAEDAVIDILEPTKYSYTNNLGGLMTATGGMFMGCQYLETIDIPESVLMISSEAFKGWTGLKRLVIPETVKYITAEGLFLECSNLEYASLPSSLKSIPPSMFSGCSSLKDFDFAGGYTSIGSSAFVGCSSLTTFDFTGITEIGNAAFAGSGLVRVRIPDGMKEVPYRAFMGCDQLKEIDFNQAEILASGSFGGCSAIETLTLDDPIREDHGAFDNCENLKEINILSQNISFYYNTSYAFPALEKIFIGKDVVSATAMGYRGMALSPDFNNFVFEEGGMLEEFGLCAGLKELASIELPESVRRLSEYAFYGCTNLKNINTLLEGIEEIGASAFTESGVRSIAFPEGLKVIEERAFQSCEELRMFTMPSTLTTIGSYAFMNCKNLMSSVVNGADLSISGDLFYGCPYITGITVGKDVRSLAFTKVIDKAITEFSFEDGSQCTKIDGNAFGSSSKVTSLKLPDSLKEIGESVFDRCKISSLTLPEGLESIGKNAFYYYKANDNLIIPASVSYIGEQAFYYAAGAKLTLNCRRTNDMQTSPFNKSEYTTLELGPEVEYIGFALYADEIHCKGSVPAAFGKYGQLNVKNKKIYVPNDAYKEYYLSWQKYADMLVCEDGTVPEISEDDLGITESADNAFFYRTSDNKMVDVSAFDNGAGGANITAHSYLAGYFAIVFDSPVKTLPASAFASAGLTELVLPTKLETIEKYALENNAGLKELAIPESVTKINPSAFYGDKELTVYFDSEKSPEFIDGYKSIAAKEFIVPYEGLLKYRSAALGFAPNIRTIDGREPELDENHVIYFVPIVTRGLYGEITGFDLENIYKRFGKETSTDQAYDFGAEKLYCTYSNNKYVLVFGGNVTRLPQYFGELGRTIELTEAIIPSTVDYVDQRSLSGNDRTSRVLYFQSTYPPQMPERTISGGYDPAKSEEYIKTIYVPSQSVAAYKSAAGWSLYADRIVGYDY